MMLPNPKQVSFYFDFISPYSYLASQRLHQDPRLALADWTYRPVVFGSVLSSLGAKGPGEIPARRRHGLQDVILLAQSYGLPLAGPPRHPFNSVWALRSVCDLETEADKLRLLERYFFKTWGEGADLEDIGVLKAILAELGIEQDPEAAATKSENRKRLKANTQALLALGGWGVPTFEVDGLLFFGHDRLPLLASYLEGGLNADPTKLQTLLARPQPGRIE